MKTRAWFFIFSVLALCLSAIAQTTAPAAGLDVREWVILVTDPYQPQANAAASIGNTLPEFVESRRSRAGASQRNDPMPVGIIRVRGHFESPIDVKLDVRNGRFLASWPAAKPRANSILWRDLSITNEPQRLLAFESDHWLNTLRQGDAPYLVSAERGERFLLYDAELAYQLPLKVLAKSDGDIQFNNSGSAPLRDVVAYRPDGAGWRSMAVGDVASYAGSAVGPSATAPSTEPAPRQFSDAPRDLNAVLADWAVRLAPWDLSPQDIELIGKILRTYALDSKRLTAVYRLDDAEMERMLALEVVPAPRSIKRLGLVIVRNTDPSVQSEIDALVLQLGDNDWQKREQASDTLSRIGPAARAKLTAAVSNRDAEIAMRAERLLAAMQKTPGAP